MIWKRALICGAGIFALLLSGAPRLLQAQEAEEPAALIVIRINTAEFLGRYNYEASISKTCEFLLKEINPRCPDQRGETLFNVADVRAVIDEFSKSLVVESPGAENVIRQRLYYRGSSVKGRRFCQAPEGSTLKSEDTMLSAKPLFYSENTELLDQLANSINDLAETCRVEAGG